MRRGADFALSRAGEVPGRAVGNTDNQTAETTAITFTQYLSTIMADGEWGGALNVQQTITDTNRVAERLPNGTWRALSTGANAAVQRSDLCARWIALYCRRVHLAGHARGIMERDGV